jgi:hypothetical protein
MDGDLATNLYVFKHNLIQESIYESVSFSQRRSLHKLIAQWYESTASTDEITMLDNSTLQLLAFHWKAAEESSKALEYFSEIGERAVRMIARPEIISAFNVALELNEKLGNPKENHIQAVRWTSFIAGAWLNMGRAKECIQVSFIGDDDRILMRIIMEISIGWRRYVKEIWLFFPAHQMHGIFENR